MRRFPLRGGVAALFIMAMASGSARADFVLLDNFNRANSSSLGSNWTQQSGSIGIDGNAALGSVSPSLATFNSITATSVTMDIFATANTTNYAAVVLGYGSLANNLYVKVQNNGSSPGFDTYGFYFGENGSNNGAWSNSFFGTLSSSFTSARITVSLVGSTVTLAIDTAFSGTPSQVYTATNVPTNLLGNGIGIGAYGTTKIDNFGINVVPEPSSIVMASIGGLGLIGVAVRRRRAALAR